MLSLILIGATITVGPSGAFPKPCAAIAKANAGDVIEVDAAGNYDGDTCAWATDNLTVKGVNGRAKIDLTGVTPNQEKGIFTITAPNATIQNFELSGAAISQTDGNNGAGIRHQGGNLTVTNCYFHDNQDGILANPVTNGQGAVVIEYSEFSNNGAGDGYSHNMYINNYASFTLRYSYSHSAKVGHLVKTRAEQNFILYNRITDETGTASYEIDIPNGGSSYVIGNLIEQSATSQNPNIVTTGEEGTSNTDQQFYFVNNTVVNDLGSGTFVNLASGTTALLENNIFRGAGMIVNGTATQTTNWDDTQGDPKLTNESTFDYHLLAGSPCIDKGTTPSGANQAPDHEYVQSANTETRTTVGAAIDIGAYEFGNTTAPSDAGTTLTDAGTVANDAGTTTTTTSSGCGCDVPGRSSNRNAWTLTIIFLGLVSSAGRLRRRSARRSRPS